MAGEGRHSADIGPCLWVEVQLGQMQQLVCIWPCTLLLRLQDLQLWVVPGFLASHWKSMAGMEGSSPRQL